MKCVSPYYATRAQTWVPCGKCNFCLQRRRSEWSFRLFQELKSAETAKFLTLTYAPESAVYDVQSRKANLEKSHFQDFMKRLRARDWQTRKKFREKKSPIRYYTVGEYGGEGERPHLHCLLFNLPTDTLGKISDIWGLGHVDVGDVEPASIAYVSGYVINKNDDYGTRQRPFALISKSNGGLGSGYLTPQMKKWHRRGQLKDFKNYAIFDSYKVPLHRLYKDRLFGKFEKSIMSMTIAEQQDDRWATEIQRLTALHSDPISYYDLKVMQAYDRVRVKKHSKPKF